MFSLYDTKTENLTPPYLEVSIRNTALKVTHLLLLRGGSARSRSWIGSGARATLGEGLVGSSKIVPIHICDVSLSVLVFSGYTTKYS